MLHCALEGSDEGNGCTHSLSKLYPKRISASSTSSMLVYFLIIPVCYNEVMHKFENIGSLEPARRPGELFRQAIAVRAMLEKAWDSTTVYQGITVTEQDPVSRGQCGISSAWLGRFLQDQGVDARFVEGKIYVKNKEGDDHVWVEARNVADEPLVVDLTSDQYATIFGTTVHMGVYSDSQSIIGKYTPEASFDPYHLPHKKLMTRFALLEQNIASLPRRHRIQAPKT